MFPYISQLLDILIENNSPFLKISLQKSIEYNENTERKLGLLIKQSIKNGYDDYFKTEVGFQENGKIVHFRDTFAMAGIITNIVSVTKESSDYQINRPIKRLSSKKIGILVSRMHSNSAMCE